MRGHRRLSEELENEHLTQNKKIEAEGKVVQNSRERFYFAGDILSTTMFCNTRPDFLVFFFKLMVSGYFCIHLFSSCSPVQETKLMFNPLFYKANLSQNIALRLTKTYLVSRLAAICISLDT